jgi:hypothetical protein
MEAKVNSRYFSALGSKFSSAIFPQLIKIINIFIQGGFHVERDLHKESTNSWKFHSFIIRARAYPKWNFAREWRALVLGLLLLRLFYSSLFFFPAA